ncbi:MAG: hypothetical protein ACFCU5_15300 [Pleurocapsa sp.]
MGHGALVGDGAYKLCTETSRDSPTDSRFGEGEEVIARTVISN